MKKLILLVLLSNVICLSAQTPVGNPEKIVQSDKIVPPEPVLEAFKKEFPSITPAWSMDGGNFKAVFVDPTSLKGVTIVYDKTGNVVRRDSELDNSSYPESINSFYIKNYPGEKYKTWVSTDDKGTRTYYIQRGEKLLWFDSEGKVVAK